MNPSAKSTPSTLDDLAPDARAQLLAEAKAELAKEAAAQAGADRAAAEAVNRSIASLMDPRDHLRDCPTLDDGERPRVEVYPHRVPPRPDQGEPARRVSIVRCVTCGGQLVLEAPIEATLERVEANIEHEEAKAA